jgi:anti-sigma regulatory factor (Ser/Thr protein kinase)
VTAAQEHDLIDMAFTAADLSKLRWLVGEQCVNRGIGEPRRSDFVLAVHEICANAIVYAGGGGRLILRAAGGMLHALIMDGGSDPVPGLQEPVGGDTGRGLWLAAQLADELSIATEEGGTTVSLRMRLPGSWPDTPLPRRPEPGRKAW